MRRAFKRLLQLALTAALLFACMKAWPYVRPLLGGAPVYVSGETLAQEVREQGVLVTLTHSESGVFTATLPALLIGEAQRVSAPYAYEIAFGVDLAQATVTAEGGAATVALPAAAALTHKLSVTGDITVQDFLYPLTETRYQQILSEQEAQLTQKYAADEALLARAFDTAAKRVRALLAGTGYTVEVVPAP